MQNKVVLCLLKTKWVNIWTDLGAPCLFISLFPSQQYDGWDILYWQLATRLWHKVRKMQYLFHKDWQKEIYVPVCSANILESSVSFTCVPFIFKRSVSLAQYGGQYKTVYCILEGTPERVSKPSKLKGRPNICAFWIEINRKEQKWLYHVKLIDKPILPTKSTLTSHR